MSSHDQGTLVFVGIGVVVLIVLWVMLRPAVAPRSMPTNGPSWNALDVGICLLGLGAVLLMPYAVPHAAALAKPGSNRSGTSLAVGLTLVGYVAGGVFLCANVAPTWSRILHLLHRGARRIAIMCFVVGTLALVLGLG
jgi:hypothetical protein